MLDTIVLMIPQDKFTATRYDYFDPPIGGLYRAPFIPFVGQPFIKCVQNMTDWDIENKNYKPRLTVIKRRAGKGNLFKITLYIEFSAPKLLYGNNFDEVDEVDFERVIKVLKGKLFLMGILVSIEDLMTAKVKTIHYSKNIVFDDYTTASSIINLIGKIKLTERLDFNQTDYWNGGHLVRLHAKSHSLVFYDKVADLVKSPSRAVEKADRAFNHQMDIFEAIRKQSPFEVLRMEFRLNERQKIEKFLKSLGIENDLTFKSLFNKQVARAVLLHYWDFIHNGLMPVLMQEITLFEQFELISKQRPEFRPQRVLSMIATSALIKEKGHRAVKGVFKKRYSDKALGRVYDDIKGLDYKILNNRVPIQFIHSALNDFRPIAMKNYDQTHFK